MAVGAVGGVVVGGGGGESVDEALAFAGEASSDMSRLLSMSPHGGPSGRLRLIKFSTSTGVMVIEYAFTL